MSILRPEQITEAGVFIPARDPETGEFVTSIELLAKLGELGYKGSIVDPSEIVPEKLLSYDPEKDGYLGMTSYTEFKNFIEGQGSQGGLATQIWGRFTQESVDRAVNNRFWEETVELRRERSETLDKNKVVTQNLYDKLLHESKGFVTDETIEAKKEAIEQSHNTLMSRIDSELMRIYYSIFGKEALDSLSYQDYRDYRGYLEDRLKKLKDPAEAGSPMVFARQADGTLTPLYINAHTVKTGKNYVDTLMWLDEVYVAMRSQAVFKYQDPSQRLPQLTIKFINSKISTLKNSSQHTASSQD